jgi:hypothetical protein
MRVIIPIAERVRAYTIQAEILNNALNSLGFDSTLILMPMLKADNYLIEAFNPDIVVGVNLLRHDMKVNSKIKVITWVQDSAGNLHNYEAGKRFNKSEDFIFGYTHELKEKYHYDRARCVEFPMLVNPLYFKYRRDIPGIGFVFAGNRGSDLREYFFMLKDKFGFGIGKLEKFLHELRDYYNGPDDSAAIINYGEMRDFINRQGSLSDALERLSHRDREFVFEQFLYWRFNEAVYRQTVLDWLIELGADLKIYGEDWDTNPRFKSHAGGNIGYMDLPFIYNKAVFSLHLNSMEGEHFRPKEIYLSGGTVLTRKRYLVKDENMIFDRDNYADNLLGAVAALMGCILNGRKKPDASKISGNVPARQFRRKGDLPGLIMEAERELV